MQAFGRRVAPVLCLGALTLAAASPDRPPPVPTHDAEVTYRVEPAGQPAQVVHVYFGEGGRMLRIDGPAGQGDTVLDRTTGTMTVVMTGPHAFMEVPSQGPVRDPFLLSDDMSYGRAGTTETIAGLTCADWRMTSPAGPSTACVTTDGVLLHATGSDGAGGAGSITAQAVRIAPIAASVFAPPAGFTRIAHPANPPPPQ